jgi:hypothetical protein
MPVYIISGCTNYEGCTILHSCTGLSVASKAFDDIIKGDYGTYYDTIRLEGYDRDESWVIYRHHRE